MDGSGLTTPLPGAKDWLQALRRRAIEARRGMIVSHRVPINQPNDPNVI